MNAFFFLCSMVGSKKAIAIAIRNNMESAQKVLLTALKNVNLPDDLRKLCEDLSLDEHNRVQWLEMFE